MSYCDQKSARRLTASTSISNDNTFKLFCDTQTAPTTTVNESATGYALANLQLSTLTVNDKNTHVVFVICTLCE